MGKFFLRVVSLCLCAIGLATGAANAEKRVALVIGNGAYRETAPLQNTRNDAGDIGIVLKRLGFEVIEGIDLDKRGMERSIRRFETMLTDAQVALFFYAGHGVQVAGQNYLVPTDAKLASEGDIDFESLPLSLILKRMERRNRTSIVLLDACRDNPLARNLARNMGTRGASIGNGLAEVKTGVGTLLSFSTQPGNVALDGSGRNSPYTSALLKEIEVPGRDILSVLATVRGAVLAATDGKQVPWEHTSLLGPVVLKPVQPDPAHAYTPASNASPAPSAASEGWALIKDSNDLEAFEAFRRRFGDTFYGDLAQARVAELKKAKTKDLAPVVMPSVKNAPKEKSSVNETKEPVTRDEGAAKETTKDLKLRQPEATANFDGKWLMLRLASGQCVQAPFEITIQGTVVKSPGGTGVVSKSGAINFPGTVSKFTGQITGNRISGSYKTSYCEGRFTGRRG